MSRRYIALLIGLYTILISCKTTDPLVTHIADTDVYYLNTDKYSRYDKDVTEFIAPYKNQLESQMNESLGSLSQTLTKSKPNSTLGNWFCDILHAEANQMFRNEVDFAIQNYGGLRIPELPKGNLIVRQIYELMPFDNQLAVANLDGYTTYKLIEHMAEKKGWPLSYGLSYKINYGKPTDIYIKGKPFDESATYRVVLSDYIVNGSDAAPILSKIGTLEESGMTIRDVVLEHLRDLKENNHTIEIDTSKRIH